MRPPATRALAVLLGLAAALGLGAGPLGAQQSGVFEVTIEPAIEHDAGTFIYRYAVRNHPASGWEAWLWAIEARADSAAIRSPGVGWARVPAAADALVAAALPEAAAAPRSPVAFSATGPRATLLPGTRQAGFAIESAWLPGPVAYWAAGARQGGPDFERVERAVASGQAVTLEGPTTRGVTIGPALPREAVATLEGAIAATRQMHRAVCEFEWIDDRRLCEGIRTELDQLGVWAEDQEYLAIVGPARAVQLELQGRARILEGHVTEAAARAMDVYLDLVIGYARQAHRDRWY